MATPLLNLPASPAARAFRAAVQVLRTDPILEKVGVRVWAWEGESRSLGTALDTDEPQPGELPAIKASPGSLSMQWETEAHHSAPYDIRLVVYSPGTNADDLLNLQHAAFMAFFPGNDQRRSEVHAIFDGISELVGATLIGTPGEVIGQAPAPDDRGGPVVGQAHHYGLRSAGAIQFLLLIPTPGTPPEEP